MQKRIRELREYFDLSQKAFAERLGMTRSMISNMELGLVEIPEYRVNTIVKEFNVNRHWLETGEGEMFLPKPESSLPAELSDDPMIRAILEAYLDLDAQDRQTFQRFFADIVARYNGESPAHQLSPAEQARARGGIPLDDFNNSSQSKSS